MRQIHLSIVLVSLSFGCTQDVQSTLDSMGDGGTANALNDMSTGGASNADAGCEQEPPPAWCDVDMTLPPPPPPVDAGQPDAEKLEEEKPDDGFDELKKENGWEGKIDDESATYTFTRLSGEEVVCNLSYVFTERTPADDCPACTEAFDAVLGPVTVDVDAEDCGQASERAGERLGFGHGRDGDVTGNHGLYIRKGDRWEKVTGGTSSMSDEGWFFSHPDAPADPEPVPEAAGVFMTGELDLNSGEGAYRFYSSRANGDLNCEVNYPVVGASPAEGCRQCAFSWDLPLSRADRTRPGPDCQFFEGLAGVTVTYGHSDDGQLYVRKNGRWSPAGGSSAVEGDLWRFRVALGQ